VKEWLKAWKSPWEYTSYQSKNPLEQVRIPGTDRISILQVATLSPVKFRGRQPTDSPSYQMKSHQQSPWLLKSPPSLHEISTPKVQQEVEIPQQTGITLISTKKMTSPIKKGRR